MKYLHTWKQNLPIQLVLALVLSHAIIGEGLQFTSLPYNDSAKVSVQTTKSTVSPGLIFTTCVFEENQETVPCTIALETSSKVGTPEHVRYCNFTYNKYVNDSDGEHLGTLESFLVLDEDKAVFSIDYLSFSNLTILHFNGCRFIPLNIGEGQRAWAEAPYNGVFDVVSAKGSSAKEQRAVYDFEGKVVAEKRNNWVESSYFVVRSPSKGRFFIDKYRTVELKVVDDKGVSQTIKEYQFDKDAWSSKHAYTISATHQLLSLCAVKNSKVTCGQFDLNAVPKFEKNLTLTNEPSTKLLLNVHNLPEGGLILLVFQCSDVPPRQCTNSKNANSYFTVKKIDATGREVGSIKVTQFPDVYSFAVDWFYFFENEKKEMCLSKLYNDDDDSGSKPGTLDVLCFKNEDFTL